MFYRPHKRVTLDCGDELVTKQAHKDECDIHNILRQYQRTGIITHISQRQAAFVDLPSEVDFQQSLHLINQANEAFAQLPSRIRDSFGNDAQRFLAAIYDPAQRDHLISLGVINAPPPPRPADPADPAGA